MKKPCLRSQLGKKKISDTKYKSFVECKSPGQVKFWSKLKALK